MSDYYLLIAGSRDFGNSVRQAFSTLQFTDMAILRSIVDETLKEWVDKGYTIHIVEGDARGTDRAAGDYALENGYDLIKFPADWDRYGKSAGYKRNYEMYDFLSKQEERGALLFWDGVSRGTRNNFSCAKHFNVSISCFDFKRLVYLSREEILEEMGE